MGCQSSKEEHETQQQPTHASTRATKKQQDAAMEEQEEKLNAHLESRGINPDDWKTFNPPDLKVSMKSTGMAGGGGMMAAGGLW